MKKSERGHGERPSEVLVGKHMTRSAETFLVNIAADDRVTHTKLIDKHPREADFFRKAQRRTPDLLQHIQSEIEPTHDDVLTLSDILRSLVEKKATRE